MSMLLLAIPFAAVLAIILLSIGVRPRWVVAVWVAIAVLATTASFLTGPDAPEAPPSAEAPAQTESGA